METNKILSANILDILFEGRNKDYGAYDLRNTYNKRINIALGITALLIIIICCTAFIGNKTNSEIFNPPDVITEPTIIDIKKDKIIEPKKIIKPQPIKTVAFVAPIIVKDKFVPEPPVENKDLVDARISTKNIEGKIDDGLQPVDTKSISTVEAPVKKENTEDQTLINVQIQARFVGNWGAYVKKEIEKNMDELTEANESGTCIVRFVVSKDGSVSNVEALTMKGTKFAEVAVNAIKKGPKWIPAIQNGTQVNAYRQQPITFKIND